MGPGLARGHAHDAPPATPTGFLSSSDRQQIYVGDDNALTLEVSAENRGEGAYEAELHVYPPPQADFTGVVRSQVGVVGLGWAGLRVGVPSQELVSPDPQQAVLRLQEGEPDHGSV